MDMKNLDALTLESVEYIKTKTDLTPEIGLVLGSGLGGLADQLEDASVIPFEEIPHFVKSTAPEHKGQLVIGRLSGKTVLCMQGRFHYYEGYSMQQVTYPIRVMKKMGIRTVILTNACGGLDTSFEPGDLMVVRDHVNFTGDNPLRGANADGFGPRFPDMTMAYSRELAALALEVAKKQGTVLREGIYFGYGGPSFETPAEIRMFQQLGGHAVGMSTVPEAIVASHCGMRLLAICCITNFAAGILDVPLTAEEVIETAGLAREKFTALLKGIVAEA
mgnify:CR=1 FL=1